MHHSVVVWWSTDSIWPDTYYKSLTGWPE